MILNVKNTSFENESPCLNRVLQQYFFSYLKSADKSIQQLNDNNTCFRVLAFQYPLFKVQV